MNNQMKIQWRTIAPIYVYNMLQDFRHVLLLDPRPNEDGFIRDSLLTYSLSPQQLQRAIDHSQAKASQKQSKYKTLQVIRRYVLITQPNLPPIQTLQHILSKDYSPKHKYYTIDYEQYYSKYPFTCLSYTHLATLPKNTEQYERYYYYPYAKFPSEILPNKVYLSGVNCSNSRMQLRDLKISLLVDFIDYEENKPTQFKQKEYKLIHVPINRKVEVEMDFNVICQAIAKEDGRVLLYCADGEGVAPAFAIALMMYYTGMNVTTATLKVCQAISRVEIEKWLYTQLLLYVPIK